MNTVVELFEEATKKFIYKYQYELLDYYQQCKEEKGIGLLMVKIDLEHPEDLNKNEVIFTANIIEVLRDLIKLGLTNVDGIYSFISSLNDLPPNSFPLLFVSVETKEIKATIVGIKEENLLGKELEKRIKIAVKMFIATNCEMLRDYYKSQYDLHGKGFVLVTIDLLDPKKLKPNKNLLYCTCDRAHYLVGTLDLSQEELDTYVKDIEEKATEKDLPITVIDAKTKSVFSYIFCRTERTEDELKEKLQALLVEAFAGIIGEDFE